MTTNQDMEKFKKSTNLEFRKGKWWYVSPQKCRRSVEATIKKNKERMYVGGKYINRDKWRTVRNSNLIYVTLCISLLKI